MPKIQKTRKQKMLADQKRETTSLLYSLPKESLKIQAKPSHSAKSTIAISTTSYQYLSGDLRKTLFLTFFIIITQLVIYYFTKGV